MTAQPAKPTFMKRLSTDEYQPLPYSDADEKVIAHASDQLTDAAERTGSNGRTFSDGRDATAAGLRALNEEWGANYFEVPVEAVLDEQAASEVFDGPETVVDVQTHFQAPHSLATPKGQMLVDLYRAVMPDWWRELEGPVQYDLATYLENVFLRTENAVAVLTSGPGLKDDDSRHLFNDEMASTRALIDGLAGTGRMLTHSVVHANVLDEYNNMERTRDEYHPAGWKVYTMGVIAPEGLINGWQLDDENGMRFLQRARELDVKLVCSHKGISMLAENGSPRDVGPAAKAFPDIDFLIYHSGYELTSYGGAPEGPYSEQTAHEGVNRLISSVLDAGVTDQRNVYAELGTTWFCLIRRPIEAAHVLGKLIKYLGADNVIWGTDSIWYGPAQSLIDAFRVFQIPDWMCDEFGYEPITPEVRAKILGQNAARVYGIDLAAARQTALTDDFSWARDYVKEYQRIGFSALR